MSHIWMCHVTSVNTSCLKHVMYAHRHITHEKKVILWGCTRHITLHVWIRHIAHMNASSHVQSMHATHMEKSFHTYEWNMLHWITCPGNAAAFASRDSSLDLSHVWTHALSVSIISYWAISCAERKNKTAMWLHNLYKEYTTFAMNTQHRRRVP